MFRWIILLVLVTCAVSLKRSRFEKEITFNDLLLFEEFSLGPPSDKSMDECAKDCHRNQSCTTFSISLDDNVCQLYGDVVYPDVATIQDLPGQRYYVDRCPEKMDFTSLRESNLCIRVFDIELTYDDVVTHCTVLGARPIVLEEEDKQIAVQEFLQNNGVHDLTNFYLGARVQGTHPNFVWVDGRTLTRNWWRGDDEPNNDDTAAYCVAFNQEGMADDPCWFGRRFICEIPQ